ncbi:MAG: hypothetical protein M1540_09485 [Candidatus Bathyarchaeota archaeon]|nr:hypothetical protein [Candidatus Bathyarchaeota archaeon]
MTTLNTTQPSNNIPMQKAQGSPQVLNYNMLGKVGLVGVEVLVGLGLSDRQARVYLALLRAGGGRARVVSKLTGISRQDIYRLFGELHRLGLVRQNLTVPVSFSPTPIAEGTRLLLERKAEETTILTAKATQLAQRLALSAPVVVESRPCFGEVFEGERGKQYKNAIEGAQGCIEFVTSWVRFRQLCFHFEAELKAALKRGVRVRVAVEKPPRHRYPKWITDYSGFELRELLSVPAVALSIFDGVEVAVAFEPTTRLTSGPDLWSRHHGVVAVCCGYFERLWAALG